MLDAFFFTSTDLEFSRKTALQLIGKQKKSYHEPLNPLN